MEIQAVAITVALKKDLINKFQFNAYECKISSLVQKQKATKKRKIG